MRSRVPTIDASRRKRRGSLCYAPRVVVDYRKSHLDKGDEYDASLAAGDFDAYMTERESAILRALIPRLFPAGVPRYLDFACGTGRITSVIEPYARDSNGVDVSESMLAHARRRCTRSTFTVRDITRNPPTAGTFDLITAFRFFGNAQHELRREVLTALHQLLATDGYLVINNHRNPWSGQSLLAAVRREPIDVDLSPRKLGALFRETGFRIERMYGIGLWVVRHKFSTRAVLESRVGAALEPLSKLPGAALFCPDAVIVARKSRP